MAWTFIRKYSPSGSVVWTRQLNFGVIDYSRLSSRGINVYVSVSYISDANSEGYDFDFIIKFSTGGVRAQGWGFVYSSADSNSVSALSTDRDGNIYTGSIEALDGREMPTAWLVAQVAARGYGASVSRPRQR